MQFIEKEASIYGLNEAIMMSLLRVIISGDHDRCIHKNKSWTRCSLKAFSEMLPFWSVHQIRIILDSLIKQGVIETANFNENPSDRTKWYAFTNQKLARMV